MLFILYLFFPKSGRLVASLFALLIASSSAEKRFFSLERWVSFLLIVDNVTRERHTPSALVYAVVTASGMARSI